VREQHFCEHHARDVVTSYSSDPWPGFSGRRASLSGAQQFEISFVIITEVYDQQCVYLHEVDGPRLFPLLIGIFEATMLYRRLNGDETPRPMTHDAWASTFRLLGAEVEHVLVYRFADHTYFATAQIRHRGHIEQLDLRPSDAFNLAVHCGSPIFISDAVLEQIGLGG
jgi:bifunctional DNase/RNase